MSVTVVAYAYRATGRVQGVGYRWHAREVAARLGVLGWVANAPDGTVIGEVTGEADAITAFVRSLEAGPPGARVSGVSLTTLDATALRFAAFEIRQ